MSHFHICSLFIVQRLIIYLIVLIVTIAVGVQDRPATAPKDIPWITDYKIIGNPDFPSAISVVCSLVFAYAGTPAFFSIVSEMREPRHFPQALVVCQTSVTSIYITIGTVIYYYCGSHVASPALGSAGVTMKKVCYSFAIPGLIVSAALVIHVCFSFLKCCMDAQVTNNEAAAGQVHLHTVPTRFQTPGCQYRDPLDELARLYWWYHGNCLYYC